LQGNLLFYFSFVKNRMFNFFSKKERVKVTDIIWITEAAKWNGILDSWQKDRPAIICWFDATLHRLQSLFSNEPGADEYLFLAGHVHPSQLTGKAVLFAEHYPLHKKEMELFERLPDQEIVVHSALEEPLFLHFGGDKIIQLMKQMGMTEDELLRHPMISKAIQTAQEKIGKKVTHESLASSAGEWLEKNIIS
jgi:hypothetical protein